MAQTSHHHAYSRHQANKEWLIFSTSMLIPGTTLIKNGSSFQPPRLFRATRLFRREEYMYVYMWYIHTIYNCLLCTHVHKFLSSHYSYKRWEHISYLLSHSLLTYPSISSIYLGICIYIIYVYTCVYVYIYIYIYIYISIYIILWY